MVKELLRDGKTFFVCEACGTIYQEKVWAEKCQEWCEKYKSCNLEIVEHAVAFEDVA